MTDREKIIETLRASGYGFFITHEKANADEALAYAADALIADGIGDVSEWKSRAEVAERKYSISLQLINSVAPFGEERFDKEITQQAAREIEEERE